MEWWVFALKCEVHFKRQFAASYECYNEWTGSGSGSGVCCPSVDGYCDQSNDWSLWQSDRFIIAITLTTKKDKKTKKKSVMLEHKMT